MTTWGDGEQQDMWGLVPSRPPREKMWPTVLWWDVILEQLRKYR